MERDMDETGLIERLKQFDGEKDRELDRGEAKKALQPVIAKIVSKGEKLLERLHALLKDEETWSCGFAIDALTEIKSEKSIRPLIEFIKENEDPDMLQVVPLSMLALAEIGSPAVEPLIEEASASFRQKKYPYSFVAALEEIEDERVQPFLLSVAKNCVRRPDDFRGWFDMDHFACCLARSNDEETLRLLKKIQQIPTDTSTYENHEIMQFIKDLKDMYEEEKPRRLNSFERLGLTEERIVKLAGSPTAETIKSLATVDLQEDENKLFSEAVEQVKKNIDLAHALLVEGDMRVSISILLLLGEAKSKKSVPFIIEIAKGSMNQAICEAASTALKAIGDPSLEHLLNETNKSFHKKAPDLHLTKTLAQFDDQKVDAFVRRVVNAYVNDPNLFGNEFRINEFVCMFYKRNNEDLVAPLSRAGEIASFSESQIGDVREAAEIAEDRKAFEKKAERSPEKLRSETISWLIYGQKIHEQESLPTPGRNDPCRCGSGKKYKKCCIVNDKSMVRPCGCKRAY